MPTDEIINFAAAYNAIYMQTSAKDDVGIEESFKKVIEDAVQTKLISMAFSDKKENSNNKELKKESMPMKKSCECWTNDLWS